MVANKFSAKKSFLRFHKIYREIPVPVHLSNTVKCLHTVRLATLIKRDSELVFQNLPFIDPL